MFLHVPGLVSEEGLERGKIVALGLVGALVESLVLGEKNGESLKSWREQGVDFENFLISTCMDGLLGMEDHFGKLK